MKVLIAVVAAFCFGLGLAGFAGHGHAGEAGEEDGKTPGRVVVKWEEIMQSIPDEAKPVKDTDSFEGIAGAFRGEMWSKRAQAVRGRGIAKSKGSGTSMVIAMPGMSHKEKELEIRIHLTNAVTDGRGLALLNIEAGDEVEFYGSNGAGGVSYTSKGKGNAQMILTLSDGLVQLVKKSPEAKKDGKK